MILFYSPGTCALAELVVLEWLKEPYRLCRLTREERNGEAYRAAINPHGQVPALRVDRRILTQNSALLLFLADRRLRRGLAPQPGSTERFELYQWLAWLDSGFHVAHYPYFAPQRYMPDPAHHDAVREHSAVGIHAALTHLNLHLVDRKHMLLGRLTVLDPYVFAMARWSERRFDYPAEFPAVHAFLERMRQDEGVKFGLAVESGEIVDALSPESPFRGHVPLAEALAGP